jgi:hypothetical protein
MSKIKQTNPFEFALVRCQIQTTQPYHVSCEEVEMKKPQKNKKKKIKKNKKK